MSRFNHHSLKRAQKGQGAAAFTVTELMVAVSLMTLIVLALYSMFNQTQRALRANESQVDSSERGRGVLELVSREMESTRVGMRADTTNLFLRTAQLPIGMNDIPGTTPPAVTGDLRSDRFDDVYYLTKSDRAWRGVGYVVLAPTNINKVEALDRPVAGVGTLYRYETPLTNRNYSFPSTNLFAGWIENLPAKTKPLYTTNATNFSQVSQGIVHFRVLPYDTKGQLMSMQTTNIDSAYQMIRTLGPLGIKPYPFSNVKGATGGAKDIGLVNVVLAQGLPGDPASTWAAFRSNAVPAYLELELGVLEPDALRTYNQMIKDDMGAQAKAFLERRIAKVQIFRKRIPLRTVAQ